MKIISKTFVALLMTSLAAPMAHAADTGGYIGVSWGMAAARNIIVDELAAEAVAAGLTVLDTSEDDSDSGYKIFAGYRLNSYFALEAAYVDLGEFTAFVDAREGGAARPIYIEGSADGLTIAAVGRLAVNDQVSCLGKLGVFDHETELSAGGFGLSGIFFTDIRDESDIDTFFGIGLDFKTSEQVSIRLEWERFDDLGDEFDIDLISLGISHHF